jgi:branched-chain amino acid transport system permease protein
MPKWLYWLIFGIVVLGVPLVAGGYVTHVMVLVCTYVMLSSSLNIIIGLNGRTCFAHTAFAIIGGYTCALTQLRLGVGYWVSLVLACVVTMTCGIVLGFPATRTRGPYLSLVTLGFAEIVRQITINAMNLTRGPLGIPGLPRPTVGGHMFSQYEMYVTCLLFAGLTIIVCKRIIHSRFGRAVMAVREDEIAAQAFGIDVAGTTVTAFALTAAFAGLGGALSATYLRLISPDSYTFADMFVMVCMVILGGAGTVSGPVLGAIVLGSIPEMLRFLDEYRMLVFGALLVAGIRWWPNGVISPRLDEQILRRVWLGPVPRG